MKIRLYDRTELEFVDIIIELALSADRNMINDALLTAALRHDKAPNQAERAPSSNQFLPSQSCFLVLLPNFPHNFYRLLTAGETPRSKHPARYRTVRARFAASHMIPGSRQSRSLLIILGQGTSPIRSGARHILENNASGTQGLIEYTSGYCATIQVKFAQATISRVP